MRKFIVSLFSFLLYLSISFPVAAQSSVPVPVVGNINTISGVAAGNNNYLEFSLVNCGSNQPTVNGVAVLLNGPVDFYQGPNGTLTLSDGVTPATLYGNDIISCGNLGNTSRYSLTQFVNGQAAGPVKLYFIQSGSGLTFNVNTARPISLLPPLKYPNPTACPTGQTQTGLNADLSVQCSNLPSGASNAVVVNPTGNQNVTQPAGTSLCFGAFCYQPNGIFNSPGGSFTGQSNLFQMNGNAFWADQTGVQAGYNKLSTAGNGILYVPNSIANLTAGIALNSQAYNNIQTYGYGPFTNGLTVQTVPDFPLIDETGSGSNLLSRVSFDGLTLHGAKTPGGTADCFKTNSDSSSFVRSAIWFCGGNGMNTSVLLSHELFLASYFQQNAGSGIFYQGAAPVAGNGNSQASTDWTSIGNLNNLNGRYGWEIDNTGREQFALYSSFGDHFESNTLGAVKFKWVSGVNLLSSYIFGPQNLILGNNVVNSHVMFGSIDGTLYDQGGAYNTAAFNNYQNHLGGLTGGGPANGASGALRNKVPQIEDYMDRSEVSDWDMSANNTTAWTAGTGATIAKVAYQSQTNGDTYLRIVCSTAPCSATQTVTDATGTGSHFLKFMYATEDQTSATVNQAEVIVSNSSGTLVDSGALPSWGGPFQRNDQFWETTFQSGTPTYTLTLQCNSTSIPCLFSDVRSVRNYLLNPGFELGTLGGTPTSWTSGASGCVSSNTVVRSGTLALHCTGANALLQQTPAATAGDLYELSFWMNETAGANGISGAYGFANSGSFVNGLFTGVRALGRPAEKGDWQKVSFTVWAINPSTVASIGGILSNMDGYVDDVYMIHLHYNRQNAHDDFNALTVGGSQQITGVQGATGTKALAANGAFTPNHPVITDANGNAADAGAPQGNTTKVQMGSGTATPGDFLKYDANGNAIDGGLPITVSHCNGTTCAATTNPVVYAQVGAQLNASGTFSFNFPTPFSSTPPCSAGYTTTTGGLNFAGTTAAQLNVTGTANAFFTWSCGPW